FADHRFVESDLRGDVIVAPIRRTDEERVDIMPTQISAGFEGWPKLRIVDDFVVARPERLEFRPAIDFSFDKPDGLNCFQHSVIIEIREPAIPSPSAAGEAQLLAVLEVRRTAFLHLGGLSSAL